MVTELPAVACPCLSPAGWVYHLCHWGVLLGFFLAQEIKLSDQLFSLYVDVLETLGEWKHVSSHTLFGNTQYLAPQLTQTNILFNHGINMESLISRYLTILRHRWIKQSAHVLVLPQQVSRHVPCMT